MDPILAAGKRGQERQAPCANRSACDLVARSCHPGAASVAPVHDQRNLIVPGAESDIEHRDRKRAIGRQIELKSTQIFRLRFNRQYLGICPCLGGYEKREQSHIRAEIDEHERRPARLASSICMVSAERSQRSYICGVNNKAFSHPLRQG